MAPILGYWNIRAYGQPIRLMLAYKGEEFVDKQYSYGPPPEYSKDSWFAEKYSLGLDFPNLPYYIDGDVKLTQSIAIMRYLARKFKLDAENEKQRLRTDMVEQQGLDLRKGLVLIAYNENYEKLKPEYLKDLPTKLQQFSDYLGKNDWFAGDKLTYVDFLMYEVFDHHLVLKKDCLKQFPNLEAFMKRFEKLPTIAEYMASPKFMSFPLYADDVYFATRLTGK